MSRLPKYLVLDLAFIAALGIGVGALVHDPKEPMQEHSMAGHSAGSMELHRLMTQRKKMPMPMSGNVDKDFATMMTMHHQQAIKMADVLLKHGRNAEVKALARNMKTVQQKEITQMAPYTK